MYKVAYRNLFEISIFSRINNIDPAVPANVKDWQAWFANEAIKPPSTPEQPDVEMTDVDPVLAEALEAMGGGISQVENEDDLARFRVFDPPA